VAGVASRVINTPTAFLEDADGNVPAGLVPRINDAIADFVGKNPGKLHGLATIDAFSGEAGAREVLRAIRELKLRGIFIESAKKDMLLDAPQVRPTLKAAALLGVPVFVHPLTDPQMHTRFSKTGPIGQRLARATINSAALISLIEGGVFEDAPGLKIVVTTLALGGVLLAGGFGDGQRIRKDAALTARRHVYVDTMGIHPASVTAAVELLGADHVLAGTDWPIVVERDVPARLQRALTVAGVSAADQRMVAGGNALKLLGVG
jgi:aminocarboxymuconate-semialdehyde decarboxylase